MAGIGDNLREFLHPAGKRSEERAARRAEQERESAGDTEAGEKVGEMYKRINAKKVPRTADEAQVRDPNKVRAMGVRG